MVKTEEKTEKPVWLKFDNKDIEAIILKLAKQGMTSEKIGAELRDSYGIPSAKLYNKKIGKILKENNMYKDSSLENLQKKRKLIEKHLEKNNQDKKARRALMILAARISKLEKYKKRKNVKQNQDSRRKVP